MVCPATRMAVTTAKGTATASTTACQPQAAKSPTTNPAPPAAIGNPHQAARRRRKPLTAMAAPTKTNSAGPSPRASMQKKATAAQIRYNLTGPPLELAIKARPSSRGHDRGVDADRASTGAAAAPIQALTPLLGLGVDIGGSGIKGAIVDLRSGALATERFKVATPQPSTPAQVAKAVAGVVRRFSWVGPIGAAFPAVVTSGTARTAANVDRSWIGTNVEAVLGEALGAGVTAVNDADAAGVAEVAFGAAKGKRGLVILTTLGTGIGSALIHDGVLVPNCELGHLELDGGDAEVRASAGAREREALSWGRWAKRLQRYYRAVEDYLWPDLFVVGGGVSRRADKLLPLLELRTPIVAAELHNEAGIVGAALLAAAATASAT